MLTNINEITLYKRQLKVSFLFSKGPAHVYTSKHKVNGIR